MKTLRGRCVIAVARSTLYKGKIGLSTVYFHLYRKICHQNSSSGKRWKITMLTHQLIEIVRQPDGLLRALAYAGCAAFLTVIDRAVKRTAVLLIQHSMRAYFNAHHA